MATDKDTEISRLNADLTVIEDQITTITQNGQSFIKGGNSGFSVKFASLPELQSRADIIRAKLTAWENCELT